jgi:hypothetical protein
MDATDTVRRNRGYKITSSAKGKVYDLEDIFLDLNNRYFAGAIERPILSWSPSRARRILGHHDPVHGVIVISRSLDSSKVPRLVVEYVLYHEMLHIKHPARLEGGRTLYHTNQFRADEKRFERYQEAIDWLEQIASPIRRRRVRRQTSRRQRPA